MTPLPRRQPPNEQHQRPRKVQKLPKNQAKQPKQQQRPPQARPILAPTNRPPVKAGAAKKRPGVIVPTVIEPSSNTRRKIPPFQPNNFKPNNVQVKTVRVRKQVSPKKIRPSRKTRLKPMARTILYALRLLIVGVGIGAIVGTALSVLDPATRINQTGTSSNPNVGTTQTQINSNSNSVVGASGISLSQEILPLKTTIQNLAANNPNLKPGVFVFDLDNGSYVDINSSSSFPAASTIKIPILVAFFQDVDSGKIRLDETLTMQKEMVVGGSGDMRNKPVGTQFSALEVATKMMTISDNTATNMLIAHMGGIEALNQRFRSWGLTATTIRNPLPDLQGTNTTTPKELGNLMAMVSQGNLVSMPSRDRLLTIMRNTVRNHLLPTGLGQGATIAHKTGDIGTMLADAGLVDLPTSKRYVVAVMVQRPNNDPSAEKLISSISQAAYQQFSQRASVPTVQTVPTSVPNPVPTTGYQTPPVMNPGVPNNMVNMPATGYQTPPFINPAMPNNMVNMPATGYQTPPFINPPQYYPYQR